MASEPEVSEISTLFEAMIRNTDLSLFLPFILGFTNSRYFRRASLNADHESENVALPTDTNPTTTAPDRIVLINPITQGMIVIDGTANLETLLGELGLKEGQPPASKESIDSLPCCDICEDEDGKCVICLDEWLVGGVVKEMPCTHKFHGKCIENWLRIHGSCPICRYNMPEDEKNTGKKTDGERGERRELWVSFSIRDDRSRDSNQAQAQSPPADSSDHMSDSRAGGEIQ